MSAIQQLAEIPSEAKDNIFKRFGRWVKGFFQQAVDIYEGLTDPEKHTAIQSSGLIACINKMIDEKPEDVLKFIQEKFPDIPVDQIQGFIDGWLSRVNNVPKGNAPLSVLKSIGIAQKFLKQYTDDHSTWSIISSTAANIIASLMSPSTPVEKWISIGVALYHSIVKPHVEGDDYVAPEGEEDDEEDEQAPNATIGSSPDPDMDIVNETRNHVEGGETMNARTDAADMPASYKDKLAIKNQASIDAGKVVNEEKSEEE